MYHLFHVLKYNISTLLTTSWRWNNTNLCNTYHAKQLVWEELWLSVMSFACLYIFNKSFLDRLWAIPRQQSVDVLWRKQVQHEYTDLETCKHIATNTRWIFLKSLKNKVLNQEFAWTQKRMRVGKMAQRLKTLMCTIHDCFTSFDWQAKHVKLDTA